MIVDRLVLQQVWEALDTARGFHVADDLRTQYKNAGGTHRPSNLTRRLENAIALLDETFAAESEDDEQLPA